MSEDYEVGFGKPPKQHQFKKGRSGNAQGRRRGVKNLKTDLKEELEEMLVLREGDKPIRISKQRAALKSLFAKAIKGDARALNALINLVLKLIGTDDDVNKDRLSREEQEIVDAMLARTHGNKVADSEGDLAGPRQGVGNEPTI